MAIFRNAISAVRQFFKNLFSPAKTTRYITHEEYENLLTALNEMTAIHIPKEDVPSDEELLARVEALKPRIAADIAKANAAREAYVLMLQNPTDPDAGKAFEDLLQKHREMVDKYHVAVFTGTVPQVRCRGLRAPVEDILKTRTISSSDAALMCGIPHGSTVAGGSTTSSPPEAIKDMSKGDGWILYRCPKCNCGDYALQGKLGTIKPGIYSCDACQANFVI